MDCVKIPFTVIVALLTVIVVVASNIEKKNMHNMISELETKNLICVDWKR
jgi:hypothetical protein